MTESRTPTRIDAVAEHWVTTLVAHDPTIGTYIGRANAALPDFSPEGAFALSHATRETLVSLLSTSPVDEVDAVTRADLESVLRHGLALYDAGEYRRDLNVIESPPQRIRDSFDLMPTSNDEEWALVAERLRAVPDSLAGYRRSLAEGVERGQTPAIRQIEEVVAQLRRTAGTPNEPGFFGKLAASADPASGASSSVALEVAAAAATASSAYRELAEFVAREVAPQGAASDAFGRERYELASEGFLGARVDLDETYEWGLEELARMTHEQERIAAEIVGGPLRSGIVEEAIARLDADPARRIRGTEAFREWMQAKSDRAVEELGVTQFDIPSGIRRLDCRIAATQEGGVMYTGPSDDLSRPGTMWWSVPAGVEEFSTWRELTTVYHEGVPGHHLQIGQAAVNRGSLNEWRRQLAGTSGHAEGWALYAERLMDELGYLNDPADRLGMLDGQRMRAARVVLDIGVHLGKRRPDGRVWDGDSAFEFFAQHVHIDPQSLRFEVLRYLGWAGQAPAYKIGQRIWENLRFEAAERAESEGREFSVRDFHRDALSLGGVRLDTLQRAMRGEFASGRA
ncbi:DUF885 domain-containing protein [Leucobacter sp. CSA2]|uniref:DUF885 domain-containing protein n=1 Tax=Leucobacter edaphi TaxID=2796472 RepID=A0A934UX67_9MICO|nr:DUF885 domain-containing protein [Leucobacter edaphi]